MQRGGECEGRVVWQESVEIVTLLPPMPESGYISVCMYVDDKGMARRSPPLIHHPSRGQNPDLA